MTRNEIKEKIILILNKEIDAYSHDGLGPYLIPESVEAAAEKIIGVWDKGFTYEILK